MPSTHRLSVADFRFWDLSIGARFGPIKLIKLCSYLARQTQWSKTFRLLDGVTGQFRKPVMVSASDEEGIHNRRCGTC
jgi:hypothetical protein